MQKRNDYISWEEYFMGIAELSAKRSKDPNTQVGACAVDDKNTIISVGYNGFPRGCNDDDFPWSREGKLNKYLFVTHAELNLILNSQGKSLNGATLYVTLFPCNECAKAIIQAGIKKVVYLSDKYNGTIENKAAKMMFKAAKVETEQFSKIMEFENNYIESKVS